MAEIKQLKDPVSRRRFLAVGGSTTAVAAFLAALAFTATANSY